MSKRKVLIKSVASNLSLPVSHANMFSVKQTGHTALSVSILQTEHLNLLYLLTLSKNFLTSCLNSLTSEIFFLSNQLSILSVKQRAQTGLYIGSLQITQTFLLFTPTPQVIIDGECHLKTFIFCKKDKFKNKKILLTTLFFINFFFLRIYNLFYFANSIYVG